MMADNDFCNDLKSQNHIDVAVGEFLQKIQNSQDQQQLESLRVEINGKKGFINQQVKNIKQIEQNQRAKFGQKINLAKQKINQAILSKKNCLEQENIEKQIKTQKTDMTMPSMAYDPVNDGRIHPISQVIEEIIEIFTAIGFNIEEGPDIETDYYNFTALNFPENHPARQAHDTFFFDKFSKEQGQYMLRTHTSPVQIRTMQNKKTPHRVIIPGRTYRCDSDRTHTPMFHQLEGLVIEDNASIANLKWVIEEFCQNFFEIDNINKNDFFRYRPSYFPFTEPSLEVDIRCQRKGKEIKIGTGDEWLEILGCGMLHPNVLKNVGLQPDKYQGFAFGLGIDRIAMLKYGIADLREFFEADIDWIKHYGFQPFDIPSIYRKAKA